MNITSKRLDKIKKTKNQSKRRIHYKNKKKNGKEKNRRKNRKYNKTTGKYRKTHKRKKRAYDLKNKSLKFKENQPGKKPAPLKIMTTDKPVETVQTGGGPAWEKFKKLFRTANEKKKEEIDGLKDEIFDIISVDKENDNVADFYEWYIDELIKISDPDNKNQRYNVKNDYYKLLSKYFKQAIINLHNNLKGADENKADILYNQDNKEHLITIFKLTLTDDNQHLEVLFKGTPKKPRQVAVQAAELKKEGKKITYNDNPSISSDYTNNQYNFTNLIIKMNDILKAAREAKKEAEKKKEAAAEEAAEIEKIDEKEEQQTNDDDKKMKTEEEINNIKTNIKTPEFKAFLEKVKDKNGPYSKFLNGNTENPFKNLIENSKEMTEIKKEEKEEEEEEEEEQQTNDDDNLVKIYDFLMDITNQDKIRQSLTGKYIEELKNFNAMIESIKNARFAQATYTLPKRKHEPKIMLVKPGVPSADTAVISTDTSDLKTTEVFGDFKDHVKATQDVVDDQPLQSGGYREIYDMMLKYYQDKTANQWKDDNWIKLGEKLATLIDTGTDKQKFLANLSNGKYGEALQVADAMGKVLEKIDGENKMRFGFAYANKSEGAYNLNNKIAEAMEGNKMAGFNLKAIIRGTNEFDCTKGPEQTDGNGKSRSIGHYVSFVKLEDDNQYVYFDAAENGTPLDKDIPKIVDINDYLPAGPSCNFLIFLFNNNTEYPTTDNLDDLKVTTKDNGSDRCWINATLYAVLFGIMNKKGKTVKEDNKRVEKEVENLKKLKIENKEKKK